MHYSYCQIFNWNINFTEIVKHFKRKLVFWKYWSVVNENVFETDLVSWTGHCLDILNPESKERGKIHEI